MDFLFAAAFLGLSPLFWIVAVIAFLTVTAYADDNKFSRSIALLFFFTPVLMYLGGVGLGSLWHNIVTDPLHVLSLVAQYIGIGILYATARWVLKVYLIRSKLIRFRRQNQITGKLSPSERQGFLSGIHESIYQSIPLRARDNKARITFWLMFWPVSLPISLRPITRFFEYLYRQISGAFQGISNYAFKDIS